MPKNLVRATSLARHDRLSGLFDANVLLKCEQEQAIRSYKIRGACYALLCMYAKGIRKVVAASAGNHAQGVAASCNFLGIDGTIFMPETTTDQKTDATIRHGNGRINIRRVGDVFDETLAEALQFAGDTDATFVPPFDHPDIIAGQGTVGKEIVEEMRKRGEHVDAVFGPIGGGGLMAGVSEYMRNAAPRTRLYGIEPEGAAAMKASLDAGELVTLDSMNPFVDGAAVRTPGRLTFDMIRKNNVEVSTVPEGRLCSTVRDFIETDGTMIELAGALSIDGLQNYREEIRGKTVVCIVSGSNISSTKINDVGKEAARYHRREAELTVTMANRAGALAELTGLLHREAPHAGITFIEYRQEHEEPLATVQIDLSSRDPGEIARALDVMKKAKFSVQERKRS